jgi:hypothetical protein
MENNPEWHHKSPNEIEFQQIIKELLWENNWLKPSVN